MPFLRNAWYVAAWSDEIAPGQTLARTILGEPIVFFRGADGVLRALHDRCPHKFAPLSRGTVAGNDLVCAYHGLAFDAHGACVTNPHGALSKALCVRAYPLVEAHRTVWIWTGNAALADPARVPDFAFLSTVPETAFNGGYIHGTANYQLYVDNLLDLSHVDYLHAGSLGGGSLTRTAPKLEERADGVIAVKYVSKDEVPMPFMPQFLPPGTARVDSWIDVEWHAPSVIVLANGFGPAGAPSSESLTNVANHCLTPETELSTHYFFGGIRNFAMEDAELNRMILEDRTKTFAGEDEPMIAAQQARIGSADLLSLNPVLLGVDKAGVLVRRRLEALISAESAQRARSA